MSPRKLILAAVCLSALVSFAQEPAGPRVRRAVVRDEKPTSAEDKKLQAELLDRAYGLSKNLSDSDRAFLLGRIASASAKNDSERATKVAEEVFGITSNLKPGMNRNQAELSAVSAVAESDIPAALQMLQRMEAPPAGAQMPDLRMGLAAMLFQRHWQKEGLNGIDTLNATARRLGDSGNYPFMAMGPIIRQVARKDAEKAQSLFNDSLAYIANPPKDQMGADSIAGFLRNNQDRIPAPLMKQILEKLVKNALETKDDPNLQVTASFSNSKGKKAELKGAASFLLFQIMPLVKQVDPEWAKKLEKENEQLRLAAEMASEEGEQEVTVMAAVPAEGSDNRNAPPPAAMMEEMKAMRVDELAADDPQAALKLASEISNPSVRAGAGARVAGELAKNDPEQAAKLVKEAKKALAETKDPREKMQILTGLAKAQAAMKDKEGFAETFDQVLSLGEDLFRQALNKNPNAPVLRQAGFDPMSSAVASSMKVDVPTTLQKINEMRSTLLQAHLLVSAAASLNPGGEQRPGVRIQIEN